MSKNLFKCAALVLSVCALFASCQKPEDPKKDAVIKVEATSVSLDAAAGSKSISVTVENATDAKLNAVSDSEWLTVAVDGASVNLTYTANESSEAEREAKITLSYTSAKDVVVAVKQAKAEATVIPAEINVENTTIEISAEEGTQEVPFSIENATEATLNAVSDSEWLTVAVEDAKLVLSFTANESTEAGRQATVTLSYPTATDVELTVKQAKKEVEPEVAPFEITLVSNDVEDYQIIVTPKDPEMAYAVNLFYDDTEFQNASDEDLVAQTLQSWIEDAEMYGVSYEYLASEYADTGEITVDKNFIKELPAETDLALIVFGLSEDFRSASTTVTRFSFTTGKAKEVEIIDMTFEFDIKDLVVTVNATPEDQAFYFDILDKGNIDYYVTNYSIEELAQDLWDYSIQEYAQKYSMSAIVDDFCDKGTGSFDYNKVQLSPETDYYVIAFGLNNNGKVCSNVGVSDPFTTPAAATSSVKALSSSQSFGTGFKSHKIFKENTGLKTISKAVKFAK